MNKNNIQQIVESWTPAIKQITNNRVNESTPDKLQWMCEYAHNHANHLNEDNTAMTGGASFPFNTLYNTNGIGNATPASYAGHTAADQYNKNAYGSGDKWPALFPMALQVAARTIGFDLVNNFPLQGPTGVIPFMDYIYTGSKDVYGATPSYDGSTANPKIAPNGEKAYTQYGALAAFRSNLVVTDASTTKKDCINAMREACTPDPSTGAQRYITLSNATDPTIKLDVQFFGITRLSAQPMFKVKPGQYNVSIGSVFGDTAKLTVTIGGKTFNLEYPRAISALEDQIQGFTGSGKYDTDQWSGTYQNPFKLYEPMDRGTGEMQYPRQMSLKVFTKMFTVGTQSIAISVTQEQVQDLQKQWGINVMTMVENSAINEISQSINKHILSRLFALGWKNHCEAYEAEGINLNLDITNPTGTERDTVAFATYNENGEYLPAMPVPTPTVYGTGAFENSDTIRKKIVEVMLYAGNLVFQRGRRGPANFIVTNTKIGTMLQVNAQYGFSPIANTFNQNNGSLYPLGTVGGMTVYVDPMMANYDTRILVGRKGDKDEPGVVFAPYIMAEKVQMIAEQTAAPKVLVKSRYALVDLGWYPWLNYFTLYIKTPETL